MADMEDWSLQAIVRGTSGDFSKSVDLDMDFEINNSVVDASSADHLQFHREFLASFPEIFEALSGSSDELEELYKPFYPVAAHSDHLPPQTTSNVLDFQLEPNINGAEDRKPALNDQADQSSARTVTTGYTPKYKRRKNQHKRVVIQVTAEGLSSDMWAWRKYGQKPIKGSPYPRSYYRCSSSKGCLARKQVEQSCSDPGMFIITYTAEHSHSQPTRRNSLAGTVRQKFPTLKSSKASNSTTTIHVKQEKTEESAVISSAELVVNFNHQAVIIKEEINKEENEAAGGNDNDDVNMSEFVFSEDFFSGLEEFDEFIGDVPICQYASAQQLHVRSCS